LRFANPSPPSGWIEDSTSKLSFMLAHNPGARCPSAGPFPLHRRPRAREWRLMTDLRRRRIGVGCCIGRGSTHERGKNYSSPCRRPPRRDCRLRIRTSWHPTLAYATRGTNRAASATEATNPYPARPSSPQTTTPRSQVHIFTADQARLQIEAQGLSAFLACEKTPTELGTARQRRMETGRRDP